MTARLLPAVGTVNYNEYSFPSQFFAKISAKMVYDSSGRAVKYVQYTITIDWEIIGTDDESDTTTTSELVNIRKKLTTPARTLYFTGQGFGDDLIINTGAVKDVNFGPKPEILEWQPLGSSQACRASWRVVVCLPECTTGTPVYQGRLLEFAYDLTFDYDARGLTTRTISGEMEIPLTRSFVGSNQIPDTIHNYITRLNPRLPLGFRRTRNIQISRDKKKALFTIRDEEIDSPLAYPPNVSNIKCSQSLSTNILGGAAGGLSGNGIWAVTVNAEIETNRGIPKSYSFVVFSTILRNILIQVQKGKKNKEEGPAFLPITYSIEEPDKFSRYTNYSITYIQFCKLEQILGASGLWINIPEFNWQTWRETMGVAYSPYAYSGLRHLIGDDVIVDLCNTGTNQQAMENPVVERQKLEIFARPKCPPKESSWLHYNATIHAYQKSGRILHIPLAASDGEQIEDVGSNSNKDPVKAMVLANAKPKNKNIVQDRGVSAYLFCITGNAKRACYAINPPEIKSISGVKVKKVHASIQQGVKGTQFYPIHWSRWKICYVLDDTPDQSIPPPSDKESGLKTDKDGVYSPGGETITDSDWINR